MKKIEYDFDRAVSYVETPVSIIGPKGTKVTTACWDTGATHTIVLNSLADEIGLEPVGEAIGAAVGRSMSYKRYRVKLDLGNGIVVNGCILGTDSISRKGHLGILIGMDLISVGDFCLLSLKGKTKFSFEVDF